MSSTISAPTEDLTISSHPSAIRQPMFTPAFKNRVAAKVASKDLPGEGWLKQYKVFSILDAIITGELEYFSVQDEVVLTAIFSMDYRYIEI